MVQRFRLIDNSNVNGVLKEGSFNDHEIFKRGEKIRNIGRSSLFVTNPLFFNSFFLKVSVDQLA